MSSLFKLSRSRFLIKEIFPLRGSLAARLIWFVFLFSGGIAVFISFFEIWLEVDRETARIEHELADMLDKQAPLLAWYAEAGDEASVNRVLDDFLRNPLVHRAELWLQSGRLLARGEAPAGAADNVFRFPLLGEKDGGVNTFGQVRLEIDQDYIGILKKKRFLILLGTQSLQVILMAMFFLLGFYWLIGRQLRDLVRFADSFAGTSLPAPLRLQRREGTRDELSMLEESLNSLRQRLVEERERDERKKQELELSEAISELFAGGQHGENIFDEFCRVVAARMAFPAAIFLLPDSRGAGAAGKTGCFSELPAFPCRTCRSRVCRLMRQLLLEKQNSVLFLTDLSGQEEFCDEIRAFGVRSFLAGRFGEGKTDFAILALFSDRDMNHAAADEAMLNLALNRFVPGVTRKLAEDELRRTDRRLNLILNTMKELVVFHDEEMRVIWANRAAAEFVDLPLEQLVGKKCHEVWEGRLDPCPDCPVIRSRETFVPTSAERTSRDRILHINSYPLADEGGNMRSLQVAFDVTGQRVAEQALLASEERFRNLVEEISDCIWEVDRQIRFTYCSPRIADLLGYSVAEVLGKSPFDFLAYENAEEFSAQAFGAIKKNKRFFGLVGRAAHRDGQEVTVEVSAVPILDGTGTVKGFRGTIRDVTERVRAEAERENQRQHMVQADKMISLGILVSGVAHEVNNPTHFIMMNTPLLKRAWQDALPVLDDRRDRQGDFRLAGIPYSRMRGYLPQLLDGIDAGADRIRNIVQSLRNYARQEPSSLRQVVQVNEVVSAALVLLGNQLKKSTDHLTVELAENLPEIRGNFQRLEQVVVNIVLNACQALPSRDRRLWIRTCQGGDGWVFVEVVDEGCGIAREVMGRIMDPFFTTKREAGGTGLGLSITAGIVEEHKGRIEFFSDEGRGTRVSIALPVPAGDDDSLVESAAMPAAADREEKTDRAANNGGAMHVS